MELNTVVLAQLGLHKNEIKTYIALASLGKSTTGPIINRSGVGNSQTYLALSRLIERGLVSYQVRNNVKHYRAELPSTLIEKTKHQVEALEKLSKELEEIPEHKNKRNFVNTFEGKDGFRKAIIRHIDLLDEGSHESIIGFSGEVGELKELRSLLRVANTLAEEKHCKLRMILDNRFKNSLDEREGPSYSVRFMSPNYFTPTGVNISDKEILLSVWGDNPIAISMTEPSVIESFHKNFEYLWKLAKPK